MFSHIIYYDKMSINFEDYENKYVEIKLNTRTSDSVTAYGRVENAENNVFLEEAHIFPPHYRAYPERYVAMHKRNPEKWLKGYEINPENVQAIRDISDEVESVISKV